YADSECVSWTDGEPRRGTFAEIGANAGRLANALAKLGIKPGDRVGTFMWNSQEHMEAYLAVPSMGAILHTLNIRLFPEQLAYVINHAEDRVIVVDESILPLLEKVLPECACVEQVIVVGNGDVRYRDLLASESPEFAWPEIDERQAAAMCYTSGTTGNP